MTDPTYPLTAIRDNGETIVAATPIEAAAFNRLRPATHHVQSHLYITAMRSDGPVWRESVTRNEWIVRDAYGEVVHAHDLPDQGSRRRAWLMRRVDEARHAADRDLPIPGTGKKHRYSRGYRGFRTNIAMRAAEAALRDDLDNWDLANAHVGRRRSHDLPQVWDDVAYRYKLTSWKNHRNTQWRVRV